MDLECGGHHLNKPCKVVNRANDACDKWRLGFILCWSTRVNGVEVVDVAAL